MKDIPLIRELLDPFLTVGEAAVSLPPLLEGVNHLDKKVLKERVASDADGMVADRSKEFRFRITA
jgi:hypothetical protein